MWFYICNGILLSHVKEGNPGIYDNENGAWRHYVKWVRWVRQRKKNTIWSHLYVESKTSKKIEIKLRSPGQEKNLSVLQVDTISVLSVFWFFFLHIWNHSCYKMYRNIENCLPNQGTGGTNRKQQGGRF